MARHRTAHSQGSKYITPAGAARLRAELEQLWRHERPQVTAAVAAAAAQGDRSENAEYTYGKRRLREIDRRLRFLRQRLDGMRIVDTVPADRSRVYFGARVQVQDELGRSCRYRIVGPDELDMSPEHISIDAPLARALLGRRLHEQVSVTLPRAGDQAGASGSEQADPQAQPVRRYTIIGVDYPPPGTHAQA